MEFWIAASGWLAAIISCLSFGSFAVPIKSKECLKNDVDPLVFQTYKTAMCFITSWVVVLPFVGQPIYFTPWGIVSGLFWVPAGVAAIFAVKNAGLAVSQGLWSSIIVIVSFTWGIFIFHEQVKSIGGALSAVGLMIIGLWGMSFYSSPAFQNYEQVHSFRSLSLVDVVPQPPQHAQREGAHEERFDFHDSNSAVISHITNHISLSPTRKRENYEVVASLDCEEHIDIEDDEYQKQSHFQLNNSDDLSIGKNQYDNNDDLSCNSSSVSPSSSSYVNNSINNRNEQVRTDNEDYFLHNPSVLDIQNQLHQSSRRATIVSRRTMGLMSAMFNGLWGGSIMVPMHYAPQEAHGIGYLISFAIGATIITICLWIARIAYHYFVEGMTLHGSYHSLPSFHLKEMWRPGCTAGFLWSVGNLASMISVQHLGEGVGYSLTQASMLVSGMWGIFYFREVQGIHIRIKWFLSASVTIAGILMLSFEHVNDNAGGGDVRL